MKQGLRHWCFPVNFGRCLRTTILQNIFFWICHGNLRYLKVKNIVGGRQATKVIVKNSRLTVTRQLVFPTRESNQSSMIEYSLREKCPNTDFFLVRIFPHSDWIRTRKNSVSGHFSRSEYMLLLQIFYPTIDSSKSF